MLTLKDRRRFRRIPAQDFITPVFPWSSAPSQAQLINISIGGVAMDYPKGEVSVKDVFEMDLEIPDGFALKNLSLEKLADRTVETNDGDVVHNLRGRFLGLSETKSKQLKKIIYFTYRYYISRMEPNASLPRIDKKRNNRPQKRLPAPDLETDVLPICSSCKKIRDTRGAWHQMEAYLNRIHKVDFSHSICPDCAPKVYPWLKK